MAEKEIPLESPSSEDTMTTIDILDTSDCSLQYLFGNREAYLNLVVPLYEAAITGDWETAKSIFDKHRHLVGYGLSENLGTALHVAVTAKVNKQTSHFVKNLIKIMTEKELELQNKHSNTAFIIACACGNIKAAKIMMKKNHNLLNIHGCNGHLPLSFSALTGKYKVVKYLYSHSKKMAGNHWTYYLRRFTLMRCVECGFFDVALQIVDDCQELVDENLRILEVLARKPDALNRVKRNLITRTIEPVFRFVRTKVQPGAEEDANALELLKRTWGHATSTMSLGEIEDMLTRSSSRMLFVAAEMGNTRFIVELLRTYPDLMLIKDKHQHSIFYGLTIFHIAVMRRHQGIYNLLHEIGESSNDICVCNENMDKNNMLHLVGKSSKEMAAKTSGASLLMQRELLWFKEVEKMMPPYLREATNQAGQTPYELFYKENEDLVSKELKWMKDCMVVATLIVTIAFAVAFTVPGGYNQDHGLPIFIHHRDFLVFVIADAISLFSSSTSLLVFLSVITSRHDQRDFMYSLPRKLMIGLLALLVSVAAMMVTFSASFFVLYHKRLKWVPILIAAFATVPVIVFAILQFPLLVDMFRSMHDSHYLFDPKKRMLYTRKPRLCYNNSACWRFQYKTIIKRIFFKKC